MNILKNTIKSLYRNKLSSSINIVIIMIMIFSIAIFTIINSSTNIVMKKYRQKFETEVQIKINEKKLMEYSSSKQLTKFKEISSEDYKEFSKSKYVKNTFLNGIIMAHINNLKTEKYKPSEYSLGTNDTDINAIISGSVNDKNGSNVETIDGTMLKQDNECLVSKKFLINNDLKIGDELTISASNPMKRDNALKLKIVGSYEDKNKDTSIKEYTVYNDAEMKIQPDLYSYNDIITNYDTLLKFEEYTGSKIIYTEAKFLLKDSNSRKKFEQELRDKGLSSMYKVTIDEEAYKKIVAPIQHMYNITFAAMTSVLVIGAILLILNSIMSLEKTKYEIGVLRLSGIPKLKIAQRFLYESIIITVLCFIMGTFIAIALAQPVSNYVFEQQSNINITKQFDTDDKVIYDDIAQNNLKQEIKSLEVNLTQDSMFKIAFVALIIIILTSIVNIYNVFTYRPIQIIYNRD